MEMILVVKYNSLLVVCCRNSPMKFLIDVSSKVLLSMVLNLKELLPVVTLIALIWWPMCFAIIFLLPCKASLVTARPADENMRVPYVCGTSLMNGYLRSSTTDATNTAFCDGWLGQVILSHPDGYLELKENQRYKGNRLSIS